MYANDAADPEKQAKALDICRLNGTSFWDSQIIAAAEASGYQELLSEDLNPGQHYAKLICRNPFAS